MSPQAERSHIEFIQCQDLSWSPVELVTGAPPVRQKLLSCDQDQSEISAIVQLKAGWRADSLPKHQGACELFLLSGRLILQVGKDSFELSPGCYLRIENEQSAGSIYAQDDAEFLYLTAIGPDPIHEDAADDAGRQNCSFVDSEKIDWEIPWVLGPTPGLKIKLLWRNEMTGAYTRLIKAEPDWTENRQEHHDCVEEVYMLSGDMTMGSLGSMTAGGYIWRPAGIKHGPMHTGEGGLMFIRTDGPLKNYYTDLDGTPLNY